MDFIGWRNEYSVGNEEIDNQHKKIFKLINELYEAFVTKKNDLSTDEVLAELRDYSINHFKMEEKMFEKYNYAYKVEHKKEHESFINTVDNIIEESKGNKKLLSMKLTNFLQKWLVNHILEEDMKYRVMFNTATEINN